MPYSLREGLAAFRRTPLLLALSVLAIGLSLFVVGLFGLTAYNIRQAIVSLEERVEIVAYLRDDAGSGQVGAALEELQRLPEVESVRYVSKAEALVRATETMSEFREVFADLEVNPLPASIEVRLREGQREPPVMERVARQMQAFPFVEEVTFGQDWVAGIVSLRRIAAGATALIGGAFAAVAGIIIATAVRIAVFARREEIEIMRLVGATDGFIRRPFLVEGSVAGLLGGLLALGLMVLAHRVVSAAILEVAWPPASWVALGVLAGVVFGLASSAVAVRRHLGTT